MADFSEQNDRYCSDGLDLEIMDAIEKRLRVKGLEPPETWEIERQYRALRSKYGQNLTADIADRELWRINTLAEDQERILKALELHLTKERGSAPDEQEVTELYRVCEKKYGKPFHYRELESFLDDAAQQKALQDYKPNRLERSLEAVRDFVRKLFHRRSSPGEKSIQ